MYSTKQMVTLKAKRLSTKIAVTFGAELNPLRNVETGLFHSPQNLSHSRVSSKAKNFIFCVIFFCKYVGVPKRILVLEAPKTLSS